ncbi:MAG: hypothetical protein ACC651_02775, partial [Candidatus Scalindua sp.]
ESLSLEGKQAFSVAAEEAPSTKEEERVSAAAEEASSTEEEKTVSAVAEEASLEKKEEKASVGTKEALSVEEVSSSGVFIFGQKVESRFKKFLTAIFSIFLLPPVIVFGLSVITIVVLIAFPLISIVLPITLLSLCILFILLPVVLPLLTIVALITGKGKVQFGLENKKFAIKVLGITIPPYAGR